MTTTALFRHKSIPFEAIQVEDSALCREAVDKFTGGRATPGSQRIDSFIVETCNGGAMAHPGDWIAKIDQQNLTVHTSDEFATSFEPAAEVTKPAPTHSQIALRAEAISNVRHDRGLPADPEADWIEAERELTAE